MPCRPSYKYCDSPCSRPRQRWAVDLVFFAVRGIWITLAASLLPRFAFDLYDLTYTGLHTYLVLPHPTVPSTAQGCCWLGLSDAIRHPLHNFLEPLGHRPLLSRFRILACLSRLG